MDAAFAVALSTPQRVSPTQVGDDPNQSVRTDTYTAPTGAGFRVVGTITEHGCNVSCVRNHGPDTRSERSWPTDFDTEIAQQLALKLASAKTAKAREIYNTGRAATLVLFGQLPLGVQAQFSPVLTAADVAAKSGNISKAKETVATCIVPDALLSGQAALVALLDSTLTRATTLATATTVDAVTSL